MRGAVRERRSPATGATKSWTAPSQPRPIPQTVSSSEPVSYCNSRGAPSRMTSSAVARTSVSRQPPLTPPAVLPSSAARNFAPGRRYADPEMRTTVAIAARTPAPSRFFTRSSISAVSCQCFTGNPQRAAPGFYRRDARRINSTSTAPGRRVRGLSVAPRHQRCSGAPRSVGFMRGRRLFRGGGWAAAHVRSPGWQTCPARHALRVGRRSDVSGGAPNARTRVRAYRQSQGERVRNAGEGELGGCAVAPVLLPSGGLRRLALPALIAMTAVSAEVPLWFSSFLPVQDAPQHLAAVRAPP